MNTFSKPDHMEPTSTGVGNAGGIPEKHWFVAVMRKNNTERSTAERLQKMGYACYVATQNELREWRNGRRARVDRVVIPSVVFVRCTEAERREIVHLPYISRFMTDRAGDAERWGRKPVATVPADQIDRLRFMLGQSDAAVSFAGTFVKGQKVRVIRGGLCGLEGEIVQDVDGKSKLYVQVDLCGAASLEIAPADVEIISKV